MIVGTCVYENDKYLRKYCWYFNNHVWRNYFAMDIVSAKMTNTLAMNVSINFFDKKVRYKIDSYILYTVFLVIILLLIITIICHHCTKNRSKQKSIDVLTK